MGEKQFVCRNHAVDMVIVTEEPEPECPACSDKMVPLTWVLREALESVRPIQ